MREKKCPRNFSLYTNFNDSFFYSSGPDQAVNNLPTVTKILYFTNRSVTPFMSSINKSIGDICLRDFKNLFDRPGFFRFHFKTVDQEFGMVKEEVRLISRAKFEIFLAQHYLMKSSFP